MSDTEVNEKEIIEAMGEMAKVSVNNLKKVFPSAPAGKSWTEIEERLAKGENLKTICGISDEYMEQSYNDAKEKLLREDFEDAKEIFSTLCLYDQTTPKYWAGLGKCCEGLEYFAEGAECYKMMTLVSGGNNPITYLCMGYCYLSANEKTKALDALESGKEVGDPYDQEQRSVLDQIDELIAICRK